MTDGITIMIYHIDGKYILTSNKVGSTFLQNYCDYFYILSLKIENDNLVEINQLYTNDKKCYNVLSIKDPIDILEKVDYVIYRSPIDRVRKATVQFFKESAYPYLKEATIQQFNEWIDNVISNSNNFYNKNIHVNEYLSMIYNFKKRYHLNFKFIELKNINKLINYPSQDFIHIDSTVNFISEHEIIRLCENLYNVNIHKEQEVYNKIKKYEKII
jgi:hypothetical protein